MKIKHTLPLVHITLALALLSWDYSWQKVHRNWGASPAFSLLVGINAPVALGRALWSRHLPGWWDDGLLLVAVGLLWYWVALNLASWRQRRMAWVSSRPTFRLATDSAFIAVGTFSGLAFAAIVSDGIPPSLGLFWFCAYVGSILAWCIALISFFGRDFVIGIIHNRFTSGSGN